MNIFKMLGCLTLLFVISGCTDPNKAMRQLESAGYTDIQMLGYDLWGCSQDDTYSDKFTAKGPTGKIVSGVVCNGLVFKGGTIRLD